MFCFILLTCKSIFAEIRELFIWSKLSIAALRVLTSDSRFLCWELETCNFIHVCIYSGSSLMTGFWESSHMFTHYPEFLWQLLNWLLHSSKLAVHPLPHLLQRISHLCTETETADVISTETYIYLPELTDTRLLRDSCVCFHSPPWCISSHHEGDWPATLAPSPPAGCLRWCSAPLRTLWAHDAEGTSTPHWLCLRCAEGDRIAQVRFL